MKLPKSFLLTYLLAGSLAALPVDVQKGDTLKILSQGETLFEVLPLESESLDKVVNWLKSPPAKTQVTSKGAEILGLPVKLEISPDIAARWKSEPATLAKLFATRLNKALSEKTPAWNVGSQLVPLSESRTVEITPFRASDNLQVVSSDPTVVAVESLGNGKFSLQGLAAGRAVLSVTSSSGLALPDLPVSVKPWAARWSAGPESLTLWGEATPARVRDSVRRWLNARAYVGADTTLNLQSQKDGVFTFQATANHPDCIAVDKTFKVQLSSKPTEAVSNAKVVVLSNHPERIISEGVLFSREVSQIPFRFMWHHRNDPQGPERYLIMQLTNPSSSPRRFRAFWYGYGPSPDEIHVGHTAALDYANAGLNGLGEEFVLPAKASRVVEIRRVKPGQTVSGMAFLSELPNSGAGGPLKVEVLASRPGQPLPTAEAEIGDRGRTASGIFPANIETEATHLLGGPFAYLEYGGEPYVQDVERGHPSYGNFGTVYRTRLTLINPHTESRTATVGFASAGGAARGVLSIDRQLFDLPMGTTGDGLPVKTFELAPGEERQVDIELFPQAGSNYPVRVVVKSTFERLEKKTVAPHRPLAPAIP